MIKRIELYIQNIQKNNWGFPWHILFANILYQLFFPVFMFTKLNFGQGMEWAIVLAFVVVNVIGYLNEVIKLDQDKSEFWQDVTANNIGILIGILQWIYLIKLFI